MESAGSRSQAHWGVIYALAAYFTWGVVPVYWKQLADLPAEEILAHRVLWTLLFTGALLSATGRVPELRATLRSGPRRLLTISALLIGANWGVFLWATLNDRLLEASLGYYLNPLVNVVLGRAFLGERLSAPAKVAVGLATLAVAVLAGGAGGLPWVSLFLAITFALYGLLRKVAPVRPLVGLTVETAILTPFAAGYLIWLAAEERGSVVSFDATLLLLAGGGIVTAFPLLNFAAAARRLWLTTLGLFQYIAPSLTFLLAVGLYREPFQASHGIAFLFIWTALAVYTADALRPSGRGTRG